MDEKCVKMKNPAHFWKKTRMVYRYRLSCTGTSMQWVTCTGIGQGCTDTSCTEGNLYRYRSKVYRYRLFQQPCFDMFSRR